MKKYFSIILVLFATVCFASELLELSGNPSQGSIMFGKISDEVESVFFNYESVIVFQNTFVLGFDRDSNLKHIVTIVLTTGEMMSERFELNKRDYNIQEINELKKKYVSQPKDSDTLIRISNESKSLKAVRKLISSTSVFHPQNYIFPVTADLRITSEFGSQRILNGTPKRPHNGLDIAVPKGTAVLSPASGIVALTGHYFYNGKFVLLDHGLGLSSIYLHLDKIVVEIGDNVKEGIKIGEVGTTGRSTGNHLHWGVQFFEKRIDPNSLLELENIFLTIELEEEKNEQTE